MYVSLVSGSGGKKVHPEELWLFDDSAGIFVSFLQLPLCGSCGGPIDPDEMRPTRQALPSRGAFPEDPSAEFLGKKRIEEVWKSLGYSACWSTFLLLRIDF